nr:hypothetical protein [Streptomyces sp. 3211.6]
MSTADSTSNGVDRPVTGQRAGTCGAAGPNRAAIRPVYSRSVRYGWVPATKNRASARVLPISTGTLCHRPAAIASDGCAGSRPSPKAGPGTGRARAAETRAATGAARRHPARVAASGQPAAAANPTAASAA